MASSGQTDVAEIVAMLNEREGVNVRLALLADGEGWRLHHGEVTLDRDDMTGERAWRYATVAFLERRLPGPTVAAMLCGEPQNVGGLQAAALAPRPSSASVRRLRGQEDWGRVTTQWPRTEWTITGDSSPVQPGHEVLVGTGPSHLNFDAAFSAFFYKSPHNSNGSRSDLWRIILPQRDGWFPRMTIAPDTLTVVVDGDALTDASLELSDSAGHQVQPVTGPGSYTFALPDGLSPESLLMLRRADEWLDWRHFPAPSYGRARDASVVWEYPGPELDILLAPGEGQHLEAKREIPEAGESRKKMLKTIAAFASQDGGTVLIGVQDDLQIVGLTEKETADQQLLTIVNMIRDNLEPEPPYTARMIDHEGKKVLAIEVTAASQPCSYRNGSRLEFYVRRGPNTVPARHHEIATGFRQQQTAQVF